MDNLEIIGITKEKPLISIIVPIYNVEAYLKRCIDSILNQTYSNIEVILVDDGSTDRGGVICDLYCLQNANVKVIHQKNQGLSAARNTGIEASTGEWICFVDSDDYIEENMLEILHRTSVEDLSDMVICGFVRCDDEDHIIKVKSFERQCINSFQALERGMAESLFSVAWNKLVRRRCLGEIRFPKGKIYEDEFTTYRIIDRCETISLVDREFYHYTVRSSSITQNSYSVKNLDAIEAFYLKYLYFKEKGDDYRKLKLLAGDVFASLYYRSKENFHPIEEKEKSRVHEIDKMARDICLDNFRYWSFPRRLKLLAPGLYLFLSKSRRKMAQSQNL